MSLTCLRLTGQIVRGCFRIIILRPIVLQFMHGTLINFDSLSPPCRNNYVREIGAIWGWLEARLISQALFRFRHNAKRETNSGLRVGKRERSDPASLVSLVVAKRVFGYSSSKLRGLA